jgi:hypothetical protein
METGADIDEFSQWLASDRTNSSSDRFIEAKCRRGGRAGQARSDGVGRRGAMAAWRVLSPTFDRRRHRHFLSGTAFCRRLSRPV